MYMYKYYPMYICIYNPYETQMGYLLCLHPPLGVPMILHVYHIQIWIWGANEKK